MSDNTPSMVEIWECVCGEGSMGFEPVGDPDRFIADVRADAWDEGYETGCSSPYGTATPSGKPYDPEPNPHRE